MKTQLDKILESIDSRQTLEQVASRVDEGVNSFSVESGIIQTWSEFKQVLTRFFRHIENVVLQVPTFRSPTPEIDWGRCSRLLIKEFGINGEKAAFEIIRTGVEGGLYKVLKAVARQMIDEYTGKEIPARINHFWNVLSTDEQFLVTEEYLDKYGHLLPSELTEGNALRIKANFLKVLEEHPRFMMRLRKINRL